MKKQTNDLEGTCDNKYLGESAECEVEVNALNEIDKEWYTFVTNDKVEDSKIVENNEINSQAKEEQEWLIDANGKRKSYTVASHGGELGGFSPSNNWDLL